MNKRHALYIQEANSGSQVKEHTGTFVWKWLYRQKGRRNPLYLIPSMHLLLCLGASMRYIFLVSPLEGLFSMPLEETKAQRQCYLSPDNPKYSQSPGVWGCGSFCWEKGPRTGQGWPLKRGDKCTETWRSEQDCTLWGERWEEGSCFLVETRKGSPHFQ